MHRCHMTYTALVRSYTAFKAYRGLEAISLFIKERLYCPSCALRPLIKTLLNLLALEID